MTERRCSYTSVGLRRAVTEIARLRFFLFIAGVASASLAAPFSAAAASRTGHPPAGTPVPQRFVGVNAGGPLFSAGPQVDPARQFHMMVTNGVESVRVVFNWAAAQPYKSWADVPSGQASNFVDVHGVPTSFAATDQIVGLAAKSGMTVLPVVLFSPSWDAAPNARGISPPASAAPYANYLTALVARYGPRGTYWKTRGSRLPIRMWQIWNEPNIPFYWTQPFAKTYVTLLRAAHAAIKHADPGAEIVLAGITNYAWNSLSEIYKIHGARSLFDVIAVNPFTSTPGRVISILQKVRQSANRNGDRRKPLLATEVSWTSARGEPCPVFDWDTTQTGQARNVASLLPKLAANRKPLHLLGFYYYTWIADETDRTYDWNFAGLLRIQEGRVRAKPALGAFKRGALVLEGCRRKGRLATSCVR